LKQDLHLTRSLTLILSEALDLEDQLMLPGRTMVVEPVFLTTLVLSEVLELDDQLMFPGRMIMLAWEPGLVTVVCLLTTLVVPPLLP